VAGGRESARTDLAEIRAFLSPFAVLSPAGFRRRMVVRPDELRRLVVPTLLLWGEHEPLGRVAVAEAVTELMPRGRLEVVPGGHAPWLGHPDRLADLVTAFVQSADAAEPAESVRPQPPGL
jgi:pimeloyl-ACP methyl ester carboxylesterase